MIPKAIVMKMNLLPILLLFVFLGCQSEKSQTKQEQLSINIDFTKVKGPMSPIWAWYGYDEPNYTYMKDGTKLLSELVALSPVPVYVRCHSLLNTGDGSPALKWGSTNAYTEDPNGRPVYNWSIVDSIFDTFVSRGMKPLVEIAFMPQDLSVKPEPYKHKWKPGAPYEDIYTGWANPPKDYEKWAELVYQWVTHSIDRFGKEEVESWYWELWNEPNIGYWQGSTEEYIKLYDYTSDAVKRALPSAKIGGPHSTGPSWDEAEKFLRTFLDHIVNGKNHVTGEIGAPLDYIGFHAKGGPKLQGDTVILMNMGTQLRDISKGFEIVASYPSLKDTPIIIGESDPEGCAACSQQDYPSNAYRNGTMYSSYTAASFARKYDLVDHFGVNLKGAVTWAFEFEDQPWFNGYRDLATNGIDKPVLNVFRMFGQMSGNRVEVDGDLAYDFLTVRDSSVRGEKPDINALASIDDHKATVLLWNYHDLNMIGPSKDVVLTMSGLKTSEAKLYHYRIDQEHSNSYETWKKMSSPQEPNQEQYQMLEASGKLQLLSDPEIKEIINEQLDIQISLPGQAVSLILLEWD